MLRFQVVGDLVVAIAPYEASKPYAVTATRGEDGQLVINAHGREMIISETGFVCKREGTLECAALLGNADVSESGFTLSGGPSEISLEKGTLTATFPPYETLRKLTVPPAWQAGLKKVVSKESGLTFTGDVLTVPPSAATRAIAVPAS
jgi:hypothetical protein